VPKAKVCSLDSLLINEVIFISCSLSFSTGSWVDVFPLTPPRMKPINPDFAAD
jgi:hypothetical protein